MTVCDHSQQQSAFKVAPLQYRLWPSFFPHSSFSDFDPITSLVGYTETIRVVFLAQYPYFVAVQGNILTGSEDEGVDTFGRGIVVSTLELSS